MRALRSFIFGLLVSFCAVGIAQQVTGVSYLSASNPVYTGTLTGPNVTFTATGAATLSSIFNQINSNGIEIGNTAGSGYSVSSTGAGTGTPDTFFTRKGAANWRFGQTDAAAPVAQTISFQGVVTATSNTAGVNTTLAGSVGTGTGAGGSWIIQTAPATTTGSTPNAEVTAVTIPSTGVVQFNVTYTVATLPTCNAGLKGARSSVTDATAPTFLGVLTGGSTTFSPVVCNGTAWQPG